MRNLLSLMLFPNYSYLPLFHLRSFQRNLEHPSVEKQMRIMESAELQYLYLDTRKEVLDIVKHCNAYPLMQGKPRRFLFFIRDLVAG